MNSHEYTNCTTAGRLANLYAFHLERFEQECQDAAEEYSFRSGEDSSYTFLDGSVATFFRDANGTYGFELDHNFDIEENVAAFQAMAENISHAFAEAVLDAFVARAGAEAEVVRSVYLESVEALRLADAYKEGQRAALRERLAKVVDALNHGYAVGGNRYEFDGYDGIANYGAEVRLDRDCLSIDHNGAPFYPNELRLIADAIEIMSDLNKLR